MFRRDLVTVQSWRGVEDRLGRNLTLAENYLSLVGFAIVVLGGIGVWSVTRVFVQQKIRSIAVLKCLGARSGQTHFQMGHSLHDAQPQWKAGRHQPVEAQAQTQGFSQAGAVQHLLGDAGERPERHRLLPHADQFVSHAPRRMAQRSAEFPDRHRPLEAVLSFARHAHAPQQVFGCEAAPRGAAQQMHRAPERHGIGPAVLVFRCRTIPKGGQRHKRADWSNHFCRVVRRLARVTRDFPRRVRIGAIEQEGRKRGSRLGQTPLRVLRQAAASDS